MTRLELKKLGIAYETHKLTVLRFLQPEPHVNGAPPVVDFTHREAEVLLRMGTTGELLAALLGRPHDWVQFKASWR